MKVIYCFNQHVFQWLHSTSYIWFTHSFLWFLEYLFQFCSTLQPCLKNAKNKQIKVTYNKLKSNLEFLRRFPSDGRKKNQVLDIQQKSSGSKAYVEQLSMYEIVCSIWLTIGKLHLKCRHKYTCKKTTINTHVKYYHI